MRDAILGVERRVELQRFLRLSSSAYKGGRKALEFEGELDVSGLLVLESQRSGADGRAVPRHAGSWGGGGDFNGASDKLRRNVGSAFGLNHGILGMIWPAFARENHRVFAGRQIRQRGGCLALLHVGAGGKEAGGRRPHLKTDAGGIGREFEGAGLADKVNRAGIGRLVLLDLHIHGHRIVPGERDADSVMPQPEVTDGGGRNPRGEIADCNGRASGLGHDRQ